MEQEYSEESSKSENKKSTEVEYWGSMDEGLEDVEYVKHKPIKPRFSSLSRAGISIIIHGVIIAILDVIFKVSVSQDLYKSKNLFKTVLDIKKSTGY